MRLDESRLVDWGARIGAALSPPTFIALSGRLGAGKSVLARAIGAGAGVRTAMPSPSYTLVNRYETAGGGTLLHVDLYRLEAPEQIWELGWEQIGADDEIVVVEWPERAPGLLPSPYWHVELSVPRSDPHLRDVEARWVGGAPEPDPMPSPSCAGPVA